MSLYIQVQTFNQGGEAVDFQELCDGAFLNDVFFQMYVTIEASDGMQSDLSIKRLRA